MPERITRCEGCIQMGGVGIPRDGSEQLDVVRPDDADGGRAFADRDLVEGPVGEELLIRGSPLQHIGSRCIAERFSSASSVTELGWHDLLG